jgi:hypothetical protein
MGEADDGLYRALFVGYVADLFFKLQASERNILIEVAPEIERFVVGLWPDDQPSLTNRSRVGSDCGCPLLADNEQLERWLNSLRMSAPGR